MGNSQSCCAYSSPKQIQNARHKRKEDIYRPACTEDIGAPGPGGAGVVGGLTSGGPQKQSHSNLQHISDREPEGEYIFDFISSLISFRHFWIILIIKSPPSANN